MKGKAKIIIQHDGCLLLLKPIGKKKLSMIGGSLDKKEQPISALIREAKEEANILLETNEVKFFKSMKTIINSKPCVFYCFLLEGKDVSFQLMEKHKFKYADWIPINESLSRLKGIEKAMVLNYISNPMNTYNA